MKTLIFFFFTIIAVSISFAQTATKDSKGVEFEVKSLSIEQALNEFTCSFPKIPQFPGGIDSFRAFVKRIIQYPEAALKDSFEGRVIIEFAIDSNGEVAYGKIIKSARADLDSVCLYMISQMPAWLPGDNNGQLLPLTIYRLPLHFRMPARNKE